MKEQQGMIFSDPTRRYIKIDQDHDQLAFKSYSKWTTEILQMNDNWETVIRVEMRLVYEMSVSS